MRLYRVEKCDLPTVNSADLTALPQIHLTSSFRYETQEPNVLVLDRARCRYQGQTMEDEILRLDSRLRDICGIEHRGGNIRNNRVSGSIFP